MHYFLFLSNKDIINAMDPLVLRRIFVDIQIFATLLSLFELLYVIYQKPSRIQKLLLLLTLTVTLSNLGYLIELNAGDNFELSYIGCCIGYISKPYSLIASLFLLFEYGNIKVPKKYSLSLTLFFIFLTLLVITNRRGDVGFHNLYYSYVGYNQDKYGSPLVVVHGIFWYVYMFFTLVIFTIYAYITFIEIKYSKTKTAKQMAFLIFLVAFFSFAGLIIFIANLAYNYDTTLLGMMLGTLVMLILFTKYKMFGILTEAKNKVLDESTDGVIILDARMSLSFFNNTAQTIFPELKRNMGRKKEGKLINELEELKVNEPIFCNKRVYLLKIEIEKTGKRESAIGKTYIFNDITEHYHNNETLKNEIDKSTTKILKIQRSALISFADIVEARDGNTGDHIKDVATIAKLIANSLRNNPLHANEITDEFTNILEECAPLHDLGKLFISDKILLKPGKLDFEEFEIMKTHTTKGSDLIESSFKEIEEPKYIKMSKEITLYHHERWDGTGYPQKLKANEIPLSARIVAVADVYDALTKKRPYKEPYSKEDAIEIIKSESGTHFDPVIVEAFLKIVSQI